MSVLLLDHLVGAGERVLRHGKPECLLCGLLTGLGAEGALAEAVGATEMVIRKAVEWQAPELPLAACSDLLAKPPRVGVRSLA